MVVVRAASHDHHKVLYETSQVPTSLSADAAGRPAGVMSALWYSGLVPGTALRNLWPTILIPRHTSLPSLKYPSSHFTYPLENIFKNYQKCLHIKSSTVESKRRRKQKYNREKDSTKWGWGKTNQPSLAKSAQGNRPPVESWHGPLIMVVSHAAQLVILALRLGNWREWGGV